MQRIPDGSQPQRQRIRKRKVRVLIGDWSRMAAHNTTWAEQMHQMKLRILDAPPAANSGQEES